MKCVCCGSDKDIQKHHLYPKSQGCPDDLVVHLCYPCHRRAHGLTTNLNHCELTKAGLAAAKARGVALGWAQKQRDPEAHRRAAEKGAASTAAKADALAEQLRPILEPLLDQSLRQIAAELNAREIPTPRGKEWQAASVRNALKRLGYTSRADSRNA